MSYLSLLLTNVVLSYILCCCVTALVYTAKYRSIVPHAFGRSAGAIDDTIVVSEEWLSLWTIWASADTHSHKHILLTERGILHLDIS